MPSCFGLWHKKQGCFWAALFFDYRFLTTSPTDAHTATRCAVPALECYFLARAKK